MFSDYFFHPDHIIPAMKFITAFLKFTYHAITQMDVKFSTVLRQCFILFSVWPGNTGIHI